MAEVTSQIDRDADTHVVLGPHYALSRWRGHGRVIYLDRCYYRGDPEHVSVGWLNEYGGRDFKLGTGRKPPTIKDCAGETGSIFLADYDGPTEAADTIRPHPVRERSAQPLLEDLHSHAVAIGYRTSALVTAALEGLQTICLDRRNIMYRDDWLDLLPYADWHYDEISSGELWEHYRQLSRRQANL